MDEISENNEIKDSHFSCHWLYINNFGAIGSGSGQMYFPEFLLAPRGRHRASVTFVSQHLISPFTQGHCTSIPALFRV